MIRSSSPTEPEPATTIDTSYSEALRQPNRARDTTVTLPPASPSPTAAAPLPAYTFGGHQQHRSSSVPPKPVCREPAFHERLWEAMEDRADRFEEDSPLDIAQEYLGQQQNSGQGLLGSEQDAAALVLGSVSRPQSAPPSMEGNNVPHQEGPNPEPAPIEENPERSQSRPARLMRRASRQFGEMAENIQRSLTGWTRSRQRGTSDTPAATSDTAEQETPIQDPSAHHDDDDDAAAPDAEEEEEGFVEPSSGSGLTYTALDTRSYSLIHLVSPEEVESPQTFRPASSTSDQPSGEVLDGEGSERDMTQTFRSDHRHVSDDEEDMCDLPGLDYSDCAMSTEWEEGFVPWVRRSPSYTHPVPGGITRGRGVHIPGAPHSKSVHYRVRSDFEKEVCLIFPP